MITNSLYVASVMKLVIQESTALRLNAVFASKRAICRTYNAFQTKLWRYDLAIFGESYKVNSEKPVSLGVN